MATPTTAFAATKTYTYGCSGTLLATASQSIQVQLSSPESVPAGASYDLTVNIPTLTLTTAPTAATKLQVNATLMPSPGSVTDPGAKAGADVTTSTTVPAKSVVYKVSVPVGQTGSVTVRPTTIMLSLLSSPNTSASCTTEDNGTLSIPIGTGGGGGTGTDVVSYNCTITGGTPATAEVDIKVGMTPPATATVNTDASITWTGTVDSASTDSLTIPQGFPTTGSKIFVTIKPTGAGASPTATGEAALTNVTPGADLTTLPNVTLKVRPTTTGTVSLTAGDVAFGSSSTAALIKCVAPTTNLKTYSFTVVSGTASPSPTTTSPTPTTTSPRPTTTRTATLTITPSKTRKSQTPKAGADTGAGGTMGPDGRLFILTGTGLVAAAAIGGLVMRRRSVKG
ncbi:hypothetical protein [Nonomuraea fuscirosea]|uniref:hypothetical protein n=1 Tax=Nonomuraea fuscirosea TaxID=1291556 RepID=UPI0034214EC8